jgi:hypothetical protein
MPTSEQLEREARASRDRLSRTIDELKARLAPASIVDEATAYLQQTMQEPLLATAPSKSNGASRYALPLVLVGAGLTWLALEARRAEKKRARRDEVLTSPAEPVVTEEVAVTVVTTPIADADLASVESISIAPSPVPEQEKQGQRFP